MFSDNKKKKKLLAWTRLLGEQRLAQFQKTSCVYNILYEAYIFTRVVKFGDYIKRDLLMLFGRLYIILF